MRSPVFYARRESSLDSKHFVETNTFDEFKRRIEDEDHRQNRRIEELEKLAEEIHTLAKTSAVMCEKLINMNDKLDTVNKDVESLKSKDGETWRRVVWTVIAAILGIVVGFIFKEIGM